MPDPNRGRGVDRWRNERSSVCPIDCMAQSLTARQSSLMMPVIAMSARGWLLALWLLAPSLGKATDETPCQLAGAWTRDDNVQNIELYQTGNQWFARLLSSSENGAKPGFVLFREFSYDARKDAFVGTVVVPTSGMQASATLVCIGESRFKVTAHKFFMTKSFGFHRVEPR